MNTRVGFGVVLFCVAWVRVADAQTPAETCDLMHKSAMGPGYLGMGRSAGDNMRFTIRNNASPAPELSELFQGGAGVDAWGTD